MLNETDKAIIMVYEHFPSMFMNIAVHARVFFFFQAEDGIRDLTVTGVQTCALPIFPEGARDGAVARAFPTASTSEREQHQSRRVGWEREVAFERHTVHPDLYALSEFQIGRASCRERV